MRPIWSFHTRRKHARRSPRRSTQTAHASRFLRVAMLIWATVWFVGYLPSHERGQILTPGTSPGNIASADRTSPQNPAQCYISSGSCCNNQTPDDQPPSDPARNCAVCHLVAELFTPPDIFYSQEAEELCQEFIAESLAPMQELYAQPTYFSRGPPAFRLG